MEWKVGKPATLSNLPAEILILIFDQLLWPRDLLCFAVCNSRLYGALQITSFGKFFSKGYQVAAFQPPSWLSFPAYVRRKERREKTLAQSGSKQDEQAHKTTLYKKHTIGLLDLPFGITLQIFKHARVLDGHCLSLCHWRFYYIFQLTVVNTLLSGYSRLAGYWIFRARSYCR